MHTITIQHVNGSHPGQFLLITAGQNLGPFLVPSPFDYPLENLPAGKLMQELRWYLEDFLDYPYPPESDRADRLLEALRTWGLAVGDALFESREAGRLLDRATEQGYANLELCISSDDPGILNWPWEAMRTTDGGVLSRTSQVKRRLNALRRPPPLSEKLPRDCVNILLVTARPMEGDVSYRSISRLLVDQAEELNLPAKITVLRPPTLQQLRTHLGQHRDHYHILHFDGHGSYGDAPKQDSRSASVFAGLHGQLVFEDDQGKRDGKGAKELGELLMEYRIPVVVLNACQSGMLDERADDAFASVAGALQWAGVRSVVAMAYSLYVSGARQFLPEFYRRLFEQGSVADAARAGRQKMLERQERICSRGEFKLEDWLVPVVYEQEPVDFAFAKTAQVDHGETAARIPQEARDTENPYGFVGRDNIILELERAMRRAPAGILVHGLGGVGKTTVAQGFVRWLAATNGLGHGCYWQSFQNVHTAEYVINQMVTMTFGTDALAVGRQEKLQSLIKELRAKPYLIVWDNFEVVSATGPSGLQAPLPLEDRRLLHQFLKELRGGLTKVLITSRSPEAWLEPAHCQRIGIGGLVAEERWEYCEKIVSDFGLDICRSDKEWRSLIDLLDGHPLAMRVILPRLASGKTPTQLINAVNQNISQFQAEDADSAKLFATMSLAQESLPEALRPLLIPLSLHEGFVVDQLLHGMAQAAARELGEAEIGRFLSLLSTAGLLREIQPGIYEIHPTLTRFLESATRNAFPEQSQARWEFAFVNNMTMVAAQYAARPLHEQRAVFHYMGRCFRRAQELSDKLDFEIPFAALTQSLAAYAQNTRNWEEAVRLYESFAEHARQHANFEREAIAYHQLGTIAEAQRDFDKATTWYLKSLAITEKQGDAHTLASTFHQLGMIAQERRDFDAAEAWHCKSLAIKEKLGNEYAAATSYHQLGMIKQERHDFDNAEKWYLKSLDIFEKQGHEPEVAISNHQLGIIAYERRDFDAAEKWNLKSLEIKVRQGDEHGAALSYHQLGRVAGARGDFNTAEKWYLSSLAIFEKQRDEHGAAISYHQLGMIAGERGDFDTAEKWFLKSLAIKEKQGDEHGAAISYHQLGRIARERGDIDRAANHFTQAICRLRRFDSGHETSSVARSYRRLFDQTPPDQQAALLKQWNDHGLGEFPSSENEEERS